MQHLEVSGAVRPLKWPLGVKWLRIFMTLEFVFLRRHVWPQNYKHFLSYVTSIWRYIQMNTE